MQENDQGVWSITTDPMEPDIYNYSFSVDGLGISDPANPLVKSAFANLGLSMVHVSGDVPWEPSPGVPRGTVTQHFYHSPVAGDDRDFYVYTPPNYDAGWKEPYPVLYLLHGLGGDSRLWLSGGASNVILDNLIAQSKAKPMVVVTPSGYGHAGGPSGAMRPGMLDNFSRTLFEEVMPQVEKAYNVSKDRSQRAIIGLSMGGAEATLTGLNNLNKFAWVGSFSGAFVMWPGAVVRPAGSAPGEAQSLDKTAVAKLFPNLPAQAATQLRLLWIGCGTSDSLINVNRQFEEWLTEKGIRFTKVETPGRGHVIALWRRYLAEVAPLLFQASR
jgi:enterochelin esterase family protein